VYLPDISGSEYVTDSRRREGYLNRKSFKGPFWFYPRYGFLVIWSGLKFFFAGNPQAAVTLQSLRVMRICEKQGALLKFEGLDRFPPENGPYVFVSNHMGTLDVNALPGLIASRIPMTFVVKESLLRTPFMGRVLKRLRAIPVSRRHPGEDLNQVLNGGCELLKQGVSVILFPEGTRQSEFSERRFNSLAIKLAVKAGVPVVPVALKTDFWGEGRRIKDFGPLSPESAVHICFGDPLVPVGRGKAEHQAVVRFIKDHLVQWESPIAPE
jgi:1-acyl-sn-glycerol-3-phosphate acyltransferase